MTGAEQIIGLTANATSGAKSSPKTANTTGRGDYDNPWKAMLDKYLPEFLQLLFPEVHAAIDWSCKWRPENVALRKLSRKGLRGNRIADAAYTVTLRDGSQRLLLIHIEIQGSRESGFGRRMFDYHIRFSDQRNGPVISLAVLTDADPRWRPTEFRMELLGNVLSFQFPVAKLCDFANRIEELEASDNPFATVVLAHLRHQQWRTDVQALKRAKVTLIKDLLRRNWQRKQIEALFNFIDWVIALPEDLEEEFEKEIITTEEAKHMRFISPWERRVLERGHKQGLEKGLEKGRQEGIQKGIQKGRQEGIQKGIQKGRQEGIQKGRQEGIQKGRQEEAIKSRLQTLEMILRKRFGRIPMKIRQQMKGGDTEMLKTWIDRSLDAKSIEEVFS